MGLMQAADQTSAPGDKIGALPGHNG
jgi:hypothetical protein